MPTRITEDNDRTAIRTGSQAPWPAHNCVAGDSQHQLTANRTTGPVIWSDGGKHGSFVLSGTNHVNATYNPRNVSGVITISAYDGTTTATYQITNTATLPLLPQ